MAAQSFDPAKAPVVLLTRPAAQSARFAALLLDRMPGLRLVTCSLLEPVFLPVTLDRTYRGVILTSETGAFAASRMREALPDRAYCVGDRTAAVAQAAGFTARSAQGDAEDLIGLILSDPVAPLLHLRGREARGDLASRLSTRGIRTDEAIAYAQEAQPLNAEVIRILQGDWPVIAPLFSPRTAAILTAECQRIGVRAPMTLVAMSEAVAQSAVPLVRTVLAGHPDGDSMLEAVIDQLVAGQGA